MKKLAASLLALMAFAGAAQAQGQCMTNNERVALAVNALQTDLLVAMLSCRNVPGRDAFVGQYNAWINQHRPRLDRNFGTLRGYFRRVFGGQGAMRYDAFATSQMNESSRQSIGNLVYYCQDSVEVYQWAMGIGPQQLEAAAVSFAESRGIQVGACEPVSRRVR